MAARFINFGRQTPSPLPPDLRDWVAEDDLIHFVIAAVERLPLSTFAVNERGSGDPQFPPALLLALLIDCEANGLFGSRRTERATYRNVAVRCLCAETHPARAARKGSAKGPVPHAHISMSPFGHRGGRLHERVRSNNSFSSVRTATSFGPAVAIDAGRHRWTGAEELIENCADVGQRFARSGPRGDHGVLSGKTQLNRPLLVKVEAVSAENRGAVGMQPSGHDERLDGSGFFKGGV